MKFSRNVRLWATLASIATATLHTGAALAEQVLRYVPSSIPSILDPIVNFSGVAAQHGHLVYDQLFAVDAQFRPQPQMVETYSVSEDLKDYRMVLRQDLKFHDGSPVTSRDVVASINRWSKRDALGMRLVSAMGMKAEAIDDRTFMVSLDTPTDLLLVGFAKPLSAPLLVMREKDALTEPLTSVTEIVGSGPYRFVKGEYQPGAKMVYEKFTDYVPRQEPASNMAGGKIANIDRIEWLGIPDATTAATALQAGEVDMYESPPMDLLPLFEGQDGLVVRPVSKLGQFGWLRTNFLQPPFDKPQARRALALLIDQAEIMAFTAAGNADFWETCYSYFGCGGANETDVGTDWMRQRQVDEAKRLLAEAGYKGEKVVFLAPGDNAIIKGFAEVIAPRLQEGGLNVDVQYSDFSTMMARRSNKGTAAEGGWNMFAFWSFTYEADNPATMPFMNTACDETSYVGWYCSEKIATLKDEWMRAASEDERKAKLAAIHEISASELPVVLLGKFHSPLVYKASMKGMPDTLQPVFWGVSLEN